MKGKSVGQLMNMYGQTQEEPQETFKKSKFVSPGKSPAKAHFITQPEHETYKSIHESSVFSMPQERPAKSVYYRKPVIFDRPSTQQNNTTFDTTGF
jgi:hypothetical protein